MHQFKPNLGEWKCDAKSLADGHIYNAIIEASAESTVASFSSGTKSSSRKNTPSHGKPSSSGHTTLVQHGS